MDEGVKNEQGNEGIMPGGRSRRPGTDRRNTVYRGGHGHHGDPGLGL